MQIIKETYKQLSTLLATVQNESGQPMYQYIDLWNEQTEFLEQECGFDFPACFIEFEIPQTESIGLYQEVLPTSITLFHCEINYLDTHRNAAEGIDAGLKYLDNLSRVHNVLQAYRHSKTGNLQRSRAYRYKSSTNLIIYALVYEVELFETSVAEAKKPLQTVTVNAELDIAKRPHREPDTEGNNETWYDIS